MLIATVPASILSKRLVCSLTRDCPQPAPALQGPLPTQRPRIQITLQSVFQLSGAHKEQRQRGQADHLKRYVAHDHIL